MPLIDRNTVFASSVAALFCAPFAIAQPNLPPPDLDHSVKHYSKVVGWPKGVQPKAPSGFTVTKFAEDLRSPRWIHVLDNGDVLIVEANTEPKDEDEIKEALENGKIHSQHMGESANRITVFRDSDGDGRYDQRSVFLDGLKQPFGMEVIGEWFYVANTDALMRYRYTSGDQKISGEGEKLLELPAGGYNNHWTRNLLASPDGSKLYISVGSASNNGEYGMDEEKRRANILVVNPDGSDEKVFAAGLRNPVGMDWAPGTQELWTVVNERDDIGDELVPDYLAQVNEGEFYGWPYAYFGQHEDPRMAGQRPDLVEKTLVPEVALDAHSAALGLAFYDQNAFPERYRNGAFIGQRGSWNRTELSGYKVSFVPFKDGKPSGKTEDFLTGFIADADQSLVYGRPVGLAVLPDGSLLVADDASGVVWQVKADG